MLLMPLRSITMRRPAGREAIFIFAATPDAAPAAAARCRRH